MYENNILDDFSALHNLKQHYGLNRAGPPVAEGFLRQARFHRKIELAMMETGIEQLCKETGLNRFQIRDLTEEIAFRLGEEAFAEAVEVLFSCGLYSCIMFLNRNKARIV